MAYGPRADTDNVSPTDTGQQLHLSGASLKLALLRSPYHIQLVIFP